MSGDLGRAVLRPAPVVILRPPAPVVIHGSLLDAVIKETLERPDREVFERALRRTEAVGRYARRAAARGIVGPIPAGAEAALRSARLARGFLGGPLGMTAAAVLEAAIQQGYLDDLAADLLRAFGLGDRARGPAGEAGYLMIPGTGIYFPSGWAEYCSDQPYGNVEHIGLTGGNGCGGITTTGALTLEEMQSQFTRPGPYYASHDIHQGGFWSTSVWERDGPDDWAQTTLTRTWEWTQPTAYLGTPEHDAALPQVQPQPVPDERPRRRMDASWRKAVQKAVNEWPLSWEGSYSAPMRREQDDSGGAKGPGDDGPGGDPQVPPGLRMRPQRVRIPRYSRRSRERKLRIGRYHRSLLFKVLEGLTEVCDAVGALYNALPGCVRRATRGNYVQREFEKGNRRPAKDVPCNLKAAAVARYWRLLSPSGVVRELLWEWLQDQVIGRSSQAFAQGVALGLQGRRSPALMQHDWRPMGEGEKEGSGDNPLARPNEAVREVLERMGQSVVKARKAQDPGCEGMVRDSAIAARKRH